MTVSVVHLWRHPIKSHGQEALDRVTLTPGKTMPWDRVWAIAHEGAKADGTVWAPCVNFSRGSKAPQLLAVKAQLNETTEEITLTHPAQSPITIHPERDSARLLDWVKPLMPEERAQSARVVRVPGRGMTDTDYPSVSLANLASNEALSDIIKTDLSPLRWRANFWLDGLKPWEEFDLIGKPLQIGAAQLEVVEPIKRCLATTSNPDTGERDADTLGGLNSLGHQNFGIYARVLQGGEIKLGDTLQVL